MELPRLLTRHPKERPYLEELQRTLVDDLYRRSATTVWFLIPTLFLFREILRNAYDAAALVRWVFWYTLGVILLRWALVLHHRRRPTQDAASIRARYLRFTATTALMGLGLAGLILSASPLIGFTQLALAAVFVTGVHSVALGSMAASPRTYVQYVAPSLVALAWALLERPRSTLENLLLLMIVLYAPVLMLMNLYAHLGLRKTIVLGLELRDLALKDALTGLPNRRFLTEFMEREADQVLRGWRASSEDERRSQAQPQSLGLLVVDLDFFKSVNDEHGHADGDEVLRQLARVLEDAVRKPDIVARWGGEEFVVVVRGLARDALGELSERMRRRVAEHSFRLPSHETVRLSCSIGFGLFPFSESDPELLGWEQVLALADHALYQAKQRGRNRAVGYLRGEAPIGRGETLVRAVKDDLDGATSAGLIRLFSEAPGPAL